MVCMYVHENMSVLTTVVLDATYICTVDWSIYIAIIIP